MIGTRFVQEPELDAVTGMILPAELETPAQIWYEAYYGGFSGERTFDPLTLVPEDAPGALRHARVSAVAADGSVRRRFPVYGVGGYGAGANWAVRRSVFDRVGGFDPVLGAGVPARGGEDLAMFIDVLWRGGRIGVEPRAVVHHRHRPDLAGLHAQLHANGVGFTALLCALVSADRRHLAALVRLAPPAARAMAGRVLGRLVRRGSATATSVTPSTVPPTRVPRSLAFHELRGSRRDRPRGCAAGAPGARSSGRTPAPDARGPAPRAGRPAPRRPRQPRSRRDTRYRHGPPRAAVSSIRRNPTVAARSSSSAAHAPDEPTPATSAPPTAPPAPTAPGAPADRPPSSCPSDPSRRSAGTARRTTASAVRGSSTSFVTHAPSPRRSRPPARAAPPAPSGAGATPRPRARPRAPRRRTAPGRTRPGPRRPSSASPPRGVVEPAERDRGRAPEGHVRPGAERPDREREERQVGGRLRGTEDPAAGVPCPGHAFVEPPLRGRPELRARHEPRHARDVRVARERARDGRHPVGVDDDVVVGERDHLARGDGETGVPCPRDARPCLQDVGDARIRDRGDHVPRRRRGRRAVRDDHLEVGPRRREDGPQAGPQVLRPVAGPDHDGDAPHGCGVAVGREDRGRQRAQRPSQLGRVQVPVRGDGHVDGAGDLEPVADEQAGATEAVGSRERDRRRGERRRSVDGADPGGSRPRRFVGARQRRAERQDAAGDRAGPARGHVPMLGSGPGRVKRPGRRLRRRSPSRAVCRDRTARAP